MTRYVIDPFPSDAEMRALWRSAWGDDGPASFRPSLDRSLAHVGAYDADTIVAFVNVAWDGGQHATIFDTCVHQDWRHRGIGTRVVTEAALAARERGATWLHVDFEERLEGFHRRWGFAPTGAGLMRLA